MTIRELVEQCRLQSLQNLWTDYLNDWWWLFRLRYAIDYIHLYMNGNWKWYFTDVEEDINKTSDNTYTTTYEIANLEEEIVWDNKYIPNKVNLWLPRDETGNLIGTNQMQSNQFYRIKNDLKTIITSFNYDKIRIHYSRKHITPTNLDSLVDLPKDLENIAMQFAMWNIQPIFLEQWAQLSNNYYAQANKYLEDYKVSVWKFYTYNSIWVK